MVSRSDKANQFPPRPIHFSHPPIVLFIFYMRDLARTNGPGDFQTKRKRERAVHRWIGIGLLFYFPRELIAIKRSVVGRWSVLVKITSVIGRGEDNCPFGRFHFELRKTLFYNNNAIKFLLHGTSKKLTPCTVAFFGFYRPESIISNY